MNTNSLRNSYNVKYKALVEGERYNEEYIQKRKVKAANILKQIKQQRKKVPIASQEQLLEHIRIIQTSPFWTDDEQLRNQHRKLVGELRVLRLKKDGIWKDRVQGISETKETDETIKSTNHRQDSDDQLTKHKNHSSATPIAKSNSRLGSIWSYFWKSEKSHNANN